MKNLYTLILFSFSLNSNASWLCREASSQAEGDRFYACGHSIESSLNKARNKSRVNAQSEFKAFCRESENCKDNAYIVSPMRTECFKNENKYECHRGIEYRILPTKRSSMQYDKEAISNSIDEKKQELDELIDKLDKLNKLDELNTKINEVKKIDQIEADIELLESQVSDRYQGIKRSVGALSFHFQLNNIPLNYSDEGLFGIGIEYQEFVYKSVISVTFGTSYLFSNSKEVTESRGTANTYNDYQYYGHKGYEIYMGIPFSYGDLSVVPEIGHTNIDYKSQRQHFNNFGVPDEKEENEHNFSQSFKGLHIKYGQKYYIQYGVRVFSDSKTNRLVLGLSSQF